MLACDADTLIEPDGLLRLARPCLFDQKIAASPTHASSTFTEDFELVVRLQRYLEEQRKPGSRHPDGRGQLPPVISVEPQADCR